MNHDNHCDYDDFSEVILANDHEIQKDHNMFWAYDHYVCQVHDYDDHYNPDNPCVLDYEHNEPNDPDYHYNQILISFQHVSKNTFLFWMM